MEPDAGSFRGLLPLQIGAIRLKVAGGEGEIVWVFTVTLLAFLLFIFGFMNSLFFSPVFFSF